MTSLFHIPCFHFISLFERVHSNSMHVSPYAFSVRRSWSGVECIDIVYDTETGMIDPVNRAIQKGIYETR